MRPCEHTLPGSSGAQLWRVMAKQLCTDGEGLAEQALSSVHLEAPVQRVQDQRLGRESSQQCNGHFTGCLSLRTRNISINAWY